MKRNCKNKEPEDILVCDKQTEKYVETLLLEDVENSRTERNMTVVDTVLDFLRNHNLQGLSKPDHTCMCKISNLRKFCFHNDWSRCVPCNFDAYGTPVFCQMVKGCIRMNFDWSTIPERFQYVAFDRFYLTTAFEKMPKLVNDGWHVDHGCIMYLEATLPWCQDWKKSLLKRGEQYG